MVKLECVQNTSLSFHTLFTMMIWIPNSKLPNVHKTWYKCLALTGQKSLETKELTFLEQKRSLSFSENSPRLHFWQHQRSFKKFKLQLYCTIYGPDFQNGSISIDEARLKIQRHFVQLRYRKCAREKELANDSPEFASSFPQSKFFPST